jgi:plastocyanin
MTRPKPIWLRAIVLITCFAGAACSTSDPQRNSPVGPTPPVPSRNFIIDVAEINGPYSFYPSPATIRSEQIIVWRNSDTVTHHVVFDDMSVDTGTLAPGTLSQPITAGPGNWPYHCAIHPSMVGNVTVTASASTNGDRSERAVGAK